MNFAQLVGQYHQDPDSPIHPLRYSTKLGYDRLSARLIEDVGEIELASVGTRDILRLHKQWTGEGRIAMAHSLITHLRIIVGFGSTILEDPDCQRIRGLLAGLRFKNAGARKVWLTADQAEDVRDTACEDYRFSVALAQALQTDCAFRQGDVIGRWEPRTADAAIVDGDMMWIGGLTRESIDADMVLTHKTSKRGAVISLDLKDCPSVVEEWHAAPVSGPLIIDPDTGLPFHPWKYRRVWREMARKAGIPDNVWNMDSRAGRITAVLAAGALPNDARQLAGHSQLSTTMRYARGQNESISRALRQAKGSEDERHGDC